MTAARTRFVGLGSAHGDDRAGWIVAELFAAPSLPPPPGVDIRRADSPLDLLDGLEGIDRLVVCDSCRGSGPPGRIRRWTWPDAGLKAFRSGGTHDFGLARVLELAQHLGRLPPQVTVWTVEVRSCGPLDDLSAEVAAALPLLIHEIRNELAHPCPAELSG